MIGCVGRCVSITAGPGEKLPDQALIAPHSGGQGG
jgi:hypothetical protein